METTGERFPRGIPCTVDNLCLGKDRLIVKLELLVHRPDTRVVVLLHAEARGTDDDEVDKGFHFYFKLSSKTSFLTTLSSNAI